MRYADSRRLHTADPRSAEVSISRPNCSKAQTFAIANTKYAKVIQGKIVCLLKPKFGRMLWDSSAPSPPHSPRVPSYLQGCLQLDWLLKFHPRNFAVSWAPKRIQPEVTFYGFPSDAWTVEENRINKSLVTISRSQKKLSFFLLHGQPPPLEWGVDTVSRDRTELHGVYISLMECGALGSQKKLITRGKYAFSIKHTCLRVMCSWVPWSPLAHRIGNMFFPALKHKGNILILQTSIWFLLNTNTLYLYIHTYAGGFPGGSVVKNMPAMQEPLEMWVWSLGQEDPHEEEMTTHSSILARKSHG